ncbi:hypothetical protein OBBRIDRAFT_409898 [Obba rivulosa]|uniref:Uncharacterized protein n=1 Tax=Obba rivulosa TaxID=1052685 RepID=A0A8E2DMG3_9APHY|nr:hypothetical protein OBBRIDRAFT_409898 [Obba rivulosa]
MDLCICKIECAPVLRPPSLPSHVYLTSRFESSDSLLDWNSESAVLNQPEVFRMADLEEFQNTVLNHPIIQDRSRTAGITEGSDAEKPENEHILSQPRSAQRQNEVGPLHAIIPQPHFHGVPQPTTYHVRQTISFPPYQKAYPTALAPYTPDTVQLLLGRRFTRLAWIIPVRGALPWPKCTAACLLRSGSAPHFSRSPLPIGPSPQLDDAEKVRPEITWTRESLLSCWDFLLELRRVKSMGPLALAFHAALPSDAGSVLGHGQQSMSSGHQSTAVATAPGTIPNLLFVDHIKVFHDSAYTMQLRNIIDVWGFQLDDTQKSPERANVVPHVHHPTEQPEQTAQTNAAEATVPLSHPTKIRMFVGAKLALIDERSRGVMIL